MKTEQIENKPNQVREVAQKMYAQFMAERRKLEEVNAQRMRELDAKHCERYERLLSVARNATSQSIRRKYFAKEMTMMALAITMVFTADIFLDMPMAIGSTIIIYTVLWIIIIMKRKEMHRKIEEMEKSLDDLTTLPGDMLGKA